MTSFFPFSCLTFCLVWKVFLCLQQSFSKSLFFPFSSPCACCPTFCLHLFYFCPSIFLFLPRFFQSSLLLYLTLSHQFIHLFLCLYFVKFLQASLIVLLLFLILARSLYLQFLFICPLLHSFINFLRTSFCPFNVSLFLLVFFLHPSNLALATLLEKFSKIGSTWQLKITKNILTTFWLHNSCYMLISSLILLPTIYITIFMQCYSLSTDVKQVMARKQTTNCLILWTNPNVQWTNKMQFLYQKAELKHYVHNSSSMEHHVFWFATRGQCIKGK